MGNGTQIAFAVEDRGAGARRADGNIGNALVTTEAVDIQKVVQEAPAEFPPYDVYSINAVNVPQVPSSGVLSPPARASRERFVEDRVDGIAVAMAKEFNLPVQSAGGGPASAGADHGLHQQQSFSASEEASATFI